MLLKFVQQKSKLIVSLRNIQIWKGNHPMIDNIAAKDLFALVVDSFAPENTRVTQ